MDEGERARRVTARLMDRLALLAGCSDDPDALTRLYLSPAHARAVTLVSGWMGEAGLAVRMDAAATVIGSRAGSRRDAPALLLGSHIDTVRNAGRYDGNLGVLGGLAALELLEETGIRLPFPVRLVAFGDEEGVRFPVTLTGSRALAGTLDAAAQCAAADDAGVTLGAALAAFGGVPDRLAEAAVREPVLGFLELHIEQGPVLERAGLAVGVVSAINGASRYRIVVTGEAGHAGTVPMAGRRDPLAAAAEMLVAIRRVGLAGDGVTATVGRIEALPGAVNVIPGQVVFTLDLRAPSDAGRAAAWAAIEAACLTAAGEHGVGLAVQRVHDAPATACDPELQGRLERAAASIGTETTRLASGAGHDAMAMAALGPVAMLFVRCGGGISHNPAESILEEDALVAIRVLAAFLAQLGAEWQER